MQDFLGLGFRVEGLSPRVGLEGFRLWGLGFRVHGLGSQVRVRVKGCWV